MKVNLYDVFDCFSDESVDIKPSASISSKKILELTKQKIKEDNIMNTVHRKKKMRFVLIAAAMLALFSVTVSAAYLLSPKDIASRADDYKLAECFDENDEKFNLATQKSGEYEFALLGMVSGKNLSSYAKVNADKTYIIGAISKENGENIDDYANITVTPLIQGCEPWQLNTFSLNGEHRRFMYEGVCYFIFNCDNIEIFADRDIYIAAYEGFAPTADIFTLKSDGSITYNTGYNGTKALFVMPMDKTKANPQAAEELLEGVYNADVQYSGNPSDDEKTNAEIAAEEADSWVKTQN